MQIQAVELAAQRLRTLSNTLHNASSGAPESRLHEVAWEAVSAYPHLSPTGSVQDLVIPSFAQVAGNEPIRRAWSAATTDLDNLLTALPQVPEIPSAGAADAVMGKMRLTELRHQMTQFESGHSEINPVDLANDISGAIGSISGAARQFESDALTLDHAAAMARALG